MRNLGSRYKIGAREFTRWLVQQGGRAEVKLLVGSTFFTILLCTMRPIVCSGARGAKRGWNVIAFKRTQCNVFRESVSILDSIANIQWNGGRQAMSIAHVELEASLGRVSHGGRDSAVTQR